MTRFSIKFCKIEEDGKITYPFVAVNYFSEFAIETIISIIQTYNYSGANIYHLMVDNYNVGFGEFLNFDQSYILVQTTQKQLTK